MQANCDRDVSQETDNSTRDRLTKEYATDEIVVEWQPRPCFHNKPFCDGTHRKNGFRG